MGLREGKEGEEIRGAEETTTVLVGLQGQWLGRADSHEHTVKHAGSAAGFMRADGTQAF